MVIDTSQSLAIEPTPRGHCSATAGEHYWTLMARYGHSCCAVRAVHETQKRQFAGPLTQGSSKELAPWRIREVLQLLEATDRATHTP
jgi:hypothetical protein